MTNDVTFLIELVQGADVATWAHILEELEVLLPGAELIPCKLRASRNMHITGQCSKEAYEQAFGARVEYNRKTIPDLYRGPQMVENWVEVVPTQIPENLKAHIRRIELNHKVFLAD